MDRKRSENFESVEEMGPSRNIGKVTSARNVKTSQSGNHAYSPNVAWALWLVRTTVAQL